MSGRGDRFLPVRRAHAPFFASARVGNALYHTVGDREAAIKQLALDYTQAYVEIGHAIGVLPDEGSAARMAALGPQAAIWFMWWQAVERPLMTEWTRWKEQQLTGDTTGPGGSWIAYANRWQTDWSEIEAWRKRLLDFRDGAKRLGIKLVTPAPAALPTTIAEDVKDTAKDVAHALKNLGGDLKEKAGEGWTLLKVAVYGGLGIVGAVAVTSLVSNARSGSDPVVTWRKAYGR